MFLSQLLIDVGSNPDRPRPGRRWLRNVYHVHQRLWMGFPTPELEEQDPHFLQPFEPAKFYRPRFLFRIDASLGNPGRCVVLVQSDAEPNWDYAFQNARVLLAAPPQTRRYEPAFHSRDTLRFRVRINLCKKSREYRVENQGRVDAFGRAKSQGKRVALTWDANENPEEVVRDWFSARGEHAGFSVKELRLLSLGWLTGYKPKWQASEEDFERRLKFRAALIDGTLQVTDAPAFSMTLERGIGSGKAFGFGLLSIAPVR